LNKLSFGTGDDVRELEGKGRFQKGNAKFSHEVFEIHDRVGYSYRVEDAKRKVQTRKYKPNVGNVENVIIN
jgi:hypothetical protein